MKNYTENVDLDTAIMRMDAIATELGCKKTGFGSRFTELREVVKIKRELMSRATLSSQEQRRLNLCEAYCRLNAGII